MKETYSADLPTDSSYLQRNTRFEEKRKVLASHISSQQRQLNKHGDLQA